MKRRKLRRKKFHYFLKSLSLGFFAYLLTPKRKERKEIRRVISKIENEEYKDSFSKIIEYGEPTDIFYFLLAVRECYYKESMPKPWFVIWRECIVDKSQILALERNFIRLGGEYGRVLFNNWLIELRNYHNCFKEYAKGRRIETVPKHKNELVRFISTYPTTGGFIKFLNTGEKYYLGNYVRSMTQLGFSDHFYETVTRITNINVKEFLIG